MPAQWNVFDPLQGQLASDADSRTNPSRRREQDDNERTSTFAGAGSVHACRFPQTGNRSASRENGYWIFPP